MSETQKGGDRARGRELALLTLCHLESYEASERDEAIAVLWNDPPGEDREAELRGLVAHPRVQEFAARLLAHVSHAGAGLDETIEATSRRWRLERMDRVDRNVIRLAAAELGSEPITPRAVVLAEAVRLAARYGSERSVSFVNGLVEDLARRLRPQEAVDD